MSEEFNKCKPSDVPLAPCPVCGSETELWERVDGNDKDKAVKAVSCTHGHKLGAIEEGCPLYMPPEEFYRATSREAVQVWNSFSEAAALSRKSQESGIDATLAKVKQAIKKCYLALDKREHGSVAIHNAFREIEAALGIHWQPGEMLKQVGSDKK